MEKMKVSKLLKALILLVADVAELADALDSKSSIREDVWVRPPPSAPFREKIFLANGRKQVKQSG